MCLPSHSHTHMQAFHIFTQDTEPFIIDLFILFERISAHTVKQQFSVGFVLFMQSVWVRSI